MQYITKDDITFFIAVIGCVLGILNFYFSYKKYRIEKPSIDIIDVGVGYCIEHVDVDNQRCRLKAYLYYELYNKSANFPIHMKRAIGYFRTQQDYDGIMKNKYCRNLPIQDKIISSGEYIKSKIVYRNQYVNFEEYCSGEYFIVKVPEDFIIEHVQFDYGYNITKKITLWSRYEFDEYMYVDIKDMVEGDIPDNRITVNSSLVLDKWKLWLNDLKKYLQ